MFQAWRLKLREASEALRQGRLDEARHLLVANNLVQYLPGKRLAGDLAAALAQRALRLAAGGDTEGAWHTMEAAESLGGNAGPILSVRQQLVDRQLRQLENHLIANDPAGALREVESMERRKIGSDALRSFKEVARRMDSARKLCQRGRFADAQSQLASAMAIRPDLAVVRGRHQQCQQNQRQCRELTERMHRAMTDNAWSEVLAAADELLEMAPEFALARDARRRAWEKVDAPLHESNASPRAENGRPALRSSEQNSRYFGDAGGAAAALAEPKMADRFLLWVDAVGGFLVCLTDTLTIGQAVPESRVDVAIQGDLSRRHARIRRGGEGYVIEPLASVESKGVRVGGEPIEGITLLADGDEIELGESVRLRFRQPHALSASARLDLISRHRTQPRCDAILLMAESCVLGPRRNNHIVCRDWAEDVVLYRQEDRLYCRAMDAIEIDDRHCEGRGRLHAGSHVCGADFSLTLEEV